jgi:NADPH-dependent 2,4-dienoyl-CoA reductase/sulfur reductase-like enzyme/rhodanese-related sulfurtransferase
MSSVLSEKGSEYRVVIIGGDAAGLKVAARLRRLLPNISITVLEKTEILSYAGCGLPYYLSGDIDSFRELTTTAWGQHKDVDYFKKNKDFDVLTSHEVVSIDSDLKKVVANVADTDEVVEFSYDTLVIATGASPVDLGLPGADLDGVSCFTRPEEAKALRQSLETNSVGRVAIVGGGYIGLELCEAFGALWGIEVLLVELEDQVMSGSLDPEVANLVHNELKANDVDLRLSRKATRIRKSESGLIIVLDDGSEESVDRVILAPGVRPNGKIADVAGVKLGKSGGIIIDSFGKTSDPDIFAAGDCCELPDGVDTRILPLGSIANRMGRIVANSIAGLETDGLPQVYGTGAVKVFDLNIASTGKSAKWMKKNGLEYEQYWGSFHDHAHYYPESSSVYMKVICEKDGKLAGIQVVGAGEVVRWANMFTQILDLADGDPKALLRIEHAYAPPFATALDPLHNMGAMIIEGDGWQLSPDVLLSGGEVDWTWVCLLAEDEYNSVKMPDVKGKLLKMNLEELRSNIGELPVNNVVALCAKGPRSYEATRLLRNNGIDAKYVAGGLTFS